MMKPFVAKTFLLVIACCSVLMASAAPAKSSTAISTALTVSAGHKRTGKGSVVRKRMVARSGRRRKERRLTGKMAVAIRRTRETEGRKTAAIVQIGWPVDSRTILIPFGRYKYMPGVIADNKGITIAAEEGDEVQAVADGKVQEIFTDLDAVMLSHGNYFTTYSNLGTITVCKGDEIKAGQVIGSVGAEGQLDFWLSDEKDRMLDPEKWLRRQARGQAPDSAENGPERPPQAGTRKRL